MLTNSINQFIVEIYSDSTANHYSSYLSICELYYEAVKILEEHGIVEMGVSEASMAKLLEAMESKKMIKMADALVEYVLPIAKVVDELGIEEE